MAIYSAGRRRTMVILLLSSILLITLDLRGNAVFNAARSGFGYAMRPFEIAGEVVTRPVTRVWDGMTKVDDLERENARLQQQIDTQRSDQVAAQAALQENFELRAALNLESLASLEPKTCQVIGSSPSNFDQRVEIDCGSIDSLRVGMPVVNDAGLVGKITNVSPETSIVMLVTDPLYHVPVKVIAEVDPTPSTTAPATVPSGLAIDDVTTTTSTTTTTTLPPSSTSVPDDGSVAPGVSDTGTTTTSTSTTTTTTTLAPIEVTRETGVLDGFGGDRLPRVSFIADSPLFGRVAEGDSVLTAGGSDSLAPPNIPIGRVANVIAGTGVEGLQLEVDLNADLDRLNFVTVILYTAPREASAIQ
ncbi:MAG TPA: rod shape-determining protein MreC [Ilumatobacter sp.]|nr:rod shape-determining protein MreC [Ilumatobacter sp.]